MKKSLLLVFILLVITLSFDASSARKSRRRNNRRKSESTSTPPGSVAADSTTETPERNERNKPERNRSSDRDSNRKQHGSRRKDGKRGRQKLPVLKTSIRAKKVTERRYLKSDWCKSQPVRQHIRTTTDCHGVVINQFCYGQCNSFFIPKDLVIDSNQENIQPDYFKSCSFCKPKTLEWVSVRLRCKNIETTKMPRFITKKIKRVKGCMCVAVPDLEKAMMNDDPNLVVVPGTPVLATIDPSR